jgi:hypothetical protein
VALVWRLGASCPNARIVLFGIGLSISLWGGALQRDARLPNGGFRGTVLFVHGCPIRSTSGRTYEWWYSLNLMWLNRTAVSLSLNC